MRSARTRRLLLRMPVATIVAVVAVTGLPAPYRAAPPQVVVRAVDLLGDDRVAAPGWTARVRPTVQPELVGFSWEGDADGAVQVRARAAGGWTPWFDVHAEPDETPDAGAEGDGDVAAGPVWLGDDVGEVEVRVEHGRLRGLQLHAIRSDEPTGYGISAAGAIPARPGILSKEQWGSGGWVSTNSGCDGGPWSAAARYSIIHHTVTGNTYTSSQTDDVIRGIYAFHTQTRGWCDIAYNFVVDRFGRVWEARSGGVEKGIIGGHAKGFNTGSIGVALLGDHSSTPVTWAARTAIHDLLAWKFAVHGIDGQAKIWVKSGGSTKYAAGTWVKLRTIIGHSDVGITSCPADGYTLLPGLRRDVQRTVMGSAPYPMSGWTPVSTAPELITLDAHGGLHPVGSREHVRHGAHWGSWPIARDAVRAGTGGYVLDGFGGLHPFDGAPWVAPGGYWHGWDIAREIVPAASPGSGWVVDGFGGLHAFGGAPPFPPGGYWPGRDLTRGAAPTPDGMGGYVLDAFGGLHAFGAALPAGGPSWPGWDVARDVALRPDGRGGYVLDAFGGVHPFGGAPPLAIERYTKDRDTARGLILTGTGDAGWVMDSYGRLWNVGSASRPKTSLTWTGMAIAKSVI